MQIMLKSDLQDKLQSSFFKRWPVDTEARLYKTTSLCMKSGSPAQFKSSTSKELLVKDMPHNSRERIQPRTQSLQL